MARILLALLLPVLALSHGRAEGPVAIVDVEQVLQLHPTYAASMEEFERGRNEEEAALERARNAFVNSRQAFKNFPGINGRAREEQSDQLADLLEQIFRVQAGSARKLENKREELRSEVRRRALDDARAIAEGYGVTVLLNSANVVAATPDADMTEIVARAFQGSEPEPRSRPGGSKIGVIDLFRLANDHKDVEAAYAEFQSVTADGIARLEATAEALDQDRKELEGASIVLGTEELRAQSFDLQRRVQLFRLSQINTERQHNAIRQQLLQPIIEDIRMVAEALVQSGRYDVIIASDELLFAGDDQVAMEDMRGAMERAGIAK